MAPKAATQLTVVPTELQPEMGLSCAAADGCLTVFCTVYDMSFHANNVNSNGEQNDYVQ